jgi:hypothetical protein
MRNYYSEILKLPILNDFNYLHENSKFLGKTKNGLFSFGVESSDYGQDSINISYKNLSLKCNTLLIDKDGLSKKKLHVVNLKTDSELQVNIFFSLFSLLLTEEKYSLEEFINYFNIINDIFVNKKPYTYESLLGLYGELSFINFFEDDDILNYWHDDNFNKFDFSVTEKIKLEIKTTQKTNRIHHFKHNQLTNEIYKIFVVSLMLQKDDKGQKLTELIIRFLDRKNLSSKMATYLLNILNYIRENNESDLSFNSDFTKMNLRVFEANSVPRFSEPIKEGVFNAEYDVDLTNIKGMSLEELKDKIKL